MKRPIGQGKTNYQTAWPIFVIRIIFNHFTIRYRFAEFLHTDMPDNTLGNGMFRKFKFSQSNFNSDFLNHNPISNVTVQ